MNGQADGNLRFQATLEDDTGPGLDALHKKLQAMGASPTQIKMIISAVDQATPQIKQAHAEAAKLPKEHIIHVAAHTEGLRHIQKEIDKLPKETRMRFYASQEDFARLHREIESLPKEHKIHVTAATDQAKESYEKLKDLLKEPIEIPLRIAKGAAQSLPRTGLLGSIPGGDMMLGLAGGAGLLGGVGLLADTLKESVAANNALEQQMTALTVAVKDSGTATEQMGRLIVMSNNSIFSRSDLSQADIIAQQFNLPAFANQSKYMPQGTINAAENLAASNQTSVSQAMDTIARATQGFFRGLIPYGIPIRQEDFQSGGRFTGKSPLQAIDISSQRFSGAAEAQKNTLQGMVQEFKNQWDNKVMEPLGHFAFQGLKSLAGSALGGFSSSTGGIQIGEILDKVQDKLTQVWMVVQKGVVYFKTNLQKPLEDIANTVIKLGGIFARVFTGTVMTVVSTFGKVLLTISTAINGIIKDLGPLGTTIVGVFGVAKALSLLGFSNISSGLTRPFKELMSLNLVGFTKSLFSIPGILAKIAAFELAKGFIDAHQATVAMNNEFKKTGDYLDTINAKLAVKARLLGISSSSLKEIVASTGHTLSGDKDESHRLRTSINIAESAQRLHLGTGADTASIAQMVAQAVNSSGNFTQKNVATFTNELAGAIAATKALHYSFSDLATVITQYASSAKGAGLGGIPGAGPLMAIQSGANTLQRKGWLPSTASDANSLVSQILDNYADVPADQMGKLVKAPGGVSSFFNFANNKAGIDKFVKANTGPGSVAAQSDTAQASRDQMKKFLASVAPDALSGQYATKLPPNILPPLIPNIKNLTGGSADQNASNTAQSIDSMNKLLTQQQNEVQKVTVQLQGYQNQTDQLTMAQGSLNLTMAAFNQKTLVPLQRQLEDMQLGMSKFQVNVVSPLQSAIDALNQAQAQNTNIQQNAQWYQDKYTEGLLSGEQAALNHAHALEKMNKQIQLMQLSYQQIGAQLGTTIYDKGAKIRVEPLSGISLAFQQQELARKQQMQQLQYDLGYGEQHYKLQQAARPVFQREEIPYAKRLQEIKNLTPELDKTNQKSHDLTNEQFKLATQMYHVNRQVVAQTNAMQKLQNQIASIQQSPKERKWQDELFAIQQKTQKIGQETLYWQHHLGDVQNTLAATKAQLQDLGDLFKSFVDTSSSDKWSLAKKAIKVAFEAHVISKGEEKLLLDQLEKAHKVAEHAQQKASWKDDKRSWIGIISSGIMSAWTGGLERDIGDLFKGAISKIPFVGGTLSKALNPLIKIAEVGATAFVGIQSLRVLLRGGRWAAGKALTSAAGRILPETHIGTAVAGGWGKIQDRRLESVEKHLASLDPNSSEYQSAKYKQVQIDQSLENVSKNLDKTDIERLGDKLSGNFKDILKPITHPFGFLSELRKGSYGAAAGAAVAIPTAGLTGNTALASLAGAVADKTATYLKDRKLFMGEFQKVYVETKSVEKATEAGKKAIESFHLDLAKKAGATVDAVKGAHQSIQNMSDHLGNKVENTTAAARAVKKAVDESSTHVTKAVDDVRSAIKAEHPSTKAPKVDMTHENPRARAMREAAAKDPRAHFATAAGGGSLTSRIQGSVGRFFNHGWGAFSAGSEVVGDIHGDPTSAGYTALGAGRAGKAAAALSKAGTTAKLTDLGAEQLTKTQVAKILGGEFLKAGTVIGAVQLASSVFDHFTGMHTFSAASTNLGRPEATLMGLKETISGGGKKSDEAIKVVQELQKISTAKISGSQKTGLAQQLTGQPLNVADYLMQWAQAPTQERAFNADYKKSLGDVLDSLKTNHQAVVDETKTHWTTLTALNAVNQKMDLQGLQSYLKQHQDDHQSTNQNIIKYAQTYYGNLNSVQNEGYTQIYGTSDKWLKKIQHQINGSLKAMGVANPTADQPAQASAPASAQHHITNHAHGGFNHWIKGKGDGKGYLAHVGEEGDEMIIPLSPHRRERAKHLVAHAAGLLGGMKHAHHPHLWGKGHGHYSTKGGYATSGAMGANGLLSFAAGGFTADPGQDFSEGQEPQIVADLNRLGKAMGWVIHGISGYRTPARSVAVGGFADDPHTKGMAADIGINSSMRATASVLSAALLAKFGLYRPFYPADPNEINHIQLLPGAAQTGAIGGLPVGGPLGAAGAGGSLLPTHLPKVPHNLLKMGAAGVATNKMLHHVAHLVRSQKGGPTATAAFNLPGQGIKATLDHVGNLASLNHVFGSGTTFSPGLVARIAAWAGLPGTTFSQIAHGESSYEPGQIEPTESIGINGVPVKGYGLWQLTTGVGNDSLINRFGGPMQMLNPLKNALAARALYDAAGHSISPWHGTKYVTSAANGAFLPHYAGGKHNVNRDSELAVVHRGEAILHAGAAEAHRQQTSGHPAEAKKMHEGLKVVADILKKIERVDHMASVSAGQKKTFNDETTSFFKEIHLSRKALQSLDEKTLKQKGGDDLAALNAALRGRGHQTAVLPKIGHVRDLTGGEGQLALISKLQTEMEAFIQAHANDAYNIVKQSDIYQKAFNDAIAAQKDLPAAVKELKASLTDIPGVSNAIKAHTIANIKALGRNEAEIKAMKLDAKILHMHLTPAEIKKIKHLENIDDHLRKQMKSVESHMTPAERKRYESAAKRVEKDEERIHLPKDMLRVTKDSKLGVGREHAMEEWMKKEHGKGISAEMLSKVTGKSLKETERILGMIHDTGKKHLSAIQRLQKVNDQIAKLHAEQKVHHGKLTAAQEKQLKELQAHKKHLQKIIEESHKGHSGTHGALSKRYTQADGHHKARSAQAEGHHKARYGQSDDHHKIHEATAAARGMLNDTNHKIVHGHWAGWRGEAGNYHGSHMNILNTHHGQHMGTLNTNHVSHLASLASIKSSTDHGTGVGDKNDKNRSKAESNVESRADRHHREHLNKLDQLIKNPPRVDITNQATGASLTTNVSPSGARSR